MLGSRKKKRGTVGLDIGSSSLKVVELQAKGGHYHLANAVLDRLSQDTIVDGAIMDSVSLSAAIEKLFADHRISTPDVATSVSGHSVIVKRVTISASTEPEMEAAIQREAMQHIRFDLSEVNLSYYVLGPASGGGFDVLLLAVKREKLQSHTAVLGQASKNPVVLDIDAFALQNAFELNYEPPQGDTIALLNLGASLMNINITRGGMPLFTRDVSVGGNQYTNVLQKALDLSFEDAENLKMGHAVEKAAPDSELPHLRSVSELLLLEVHKTFDFFRQTTSPDPIQAIYLAGGTARIKGLVELLGSEFGVPVEVIDPFRKIEVNPAKFDVERIREIAPAMTIAVGLAMRGFDAA